MRIALVAVLLAGCAIATTEFDPIEYNHWIGVAYAANKAKGQCANGANNINDLDMRTEYAALYSETKSTNMRIAQASTLVKTMVDEFKARPNQTKQYCAIKLTEMERAARMIAESLAKKEM